MGFCRRFRLYKLTIKGIILKTGILPACVENFRAEEKPTIALAINSDLLRLMTLRVLISWEIRIEAGIRLEAEILEQNYGPDFPKKGESRSEKEAALSRQPLRFPSFSCKYFLKTRRLALWGRTNIP